jgi:phosphoglycerol transferase MdoB-like AlkP superfamily enzyme
MNSRSLLKFTQIHQALMIRFAIMMLIYSISRVVFYVANVSLFQETTFSGFMLIMAGGLRFDLSALLYINSLYIISQLIPFRFRYAVLYQKIAGYFFLATNAIFIAINTGDIIYYRFIFKRTTGSVIDNFANETNMGKLFMRFIFIDYWYITVFLIVLIILSVWLFRKSSVVNPGRQKSLVYYPGQLALMLVLVYLTIVGMRGGFTGTTRPITLNNAGRYVERPKEMALVLNTPFSIFRTLGKQSFNRVNFFSSNELEDVYSPIHQPDTAKSFRNKNVVVFILESFGQEYFGVYNKDLDDSTYVGYTPFFDSLVRQSLSFKYSYANGGKSIDGIPSVVSSLPSLRGSFVLSNYSTNETPSLAHELNKKGYNSAFFHGAPNGSMGFLAYTAVNGYDNYYGKTEYNNDADYDGIWGIWDEDFFQFSAETMSTFKEPFLSTIFSVSSHHPFKVPQKYTGKFPQGTLKMHQVVGYTDFAMKRFFEAAAKTTWYQNTIFVITADHTNQTEHRQYQTSLGRHSVPIIFFDPSGELKGISQKVAQQIDIMPTILSYLNYDNPYFAFGNNLLNDSINHFAISSADNFYQMAMGDYFIQFDGTATGFYNFKEDALLMNNLAAQQLAVMDSMTQVVKAFIQQYNNRMIDNKLRLDNP